MTATERVLRTVRFERSDRTPIWTPGFDPAFVEHWRKWKGVGNQVYPLDFYRNDVAILIGDERCFPSQAGFLRSEDPLLLFSRATIPGKSRRTSIPCGSWPAAVGSSSAWPPCRPRCRRQPTITPCA